jgi:negative regulator of flagellin synthesis FlgM
MKIGSHSDLPTSVTSAANATAQKVSQGAAESAKSSGASVGVSVSVSTLARSLEKPAVNSSADIDTAKVNAVKTAIKNGTYKVNPEAIADKLLSTTQDMLPRTSN